MCVSDAMDIHLGRLIDHIHLRTRDLEATRRFYTALLGALGISVNGDETHIQADELWIDAIDDNVPAPTHVHLAFQARSRQLVDKAWQAGLEAGGRDNGGPGERAYHPGYYAGFLWDPDGNNIEVVHHGDAPRSADEIVITMGEPAGAEISGE